jgi:hypothetical protein
MRKRCIVISLIIVLLMFQGCTRYEEHDTIDYKAPNWTSDNKIVFIKDFNHFVDRYGPWGGAGNVEGSYEVLTLCEINNDGTGYREIAEVARSESGGLSLWFNSTSSAGDWVTFDLKEEDDSLYRIYTIKRDGTNFNNTSVEGQYPDFSPDASKIVYQKPNQGIWIMDRDGGNDHQIISDPDAKYPAWSPDDTLIAYVSREPYGTHVIKTNGDSLGFYSTADYPKWSKNESYIFYATQYMQGISINIETSKVDSLNIRSGMEINPDYSGEYFIGYDGSWFVINRDGTNKWYLQP